MVCKEGKPYQEQKDDDGEQSWQTYATSSSTTEKKSYFGVTTHISACPIQ